MINTTTMNKEVIFQKLWDRYSTENPSVKAIHTLFDQEGEKIINDHIAFRTFNDPRISKEVLAKHFENVGYKRMQDYDFEAKKLKAFHLDHPDEDAPKVFISELLVEEFSEEAQKVIRQAIDEIPDEYYNNPDIIFQGRLWDAEHSIYQKLAQESEYAAWVYAHGYKANHFTIFINKLKKITTIEQLNDFVEKNGYPLNNSGGKIKGTPEELLQQSSTLADIIEVSFNDGTYKIPSCFYEFARRFPDENGELYGGFIAKSANKIFESTDFRM